MPETETHMKQPWAENINTNLDNQRMQGKNTEIERTTNQWIKDEEPARDGPIQFCSQNLYVHINTERIRAPLGLKCTGLYSGTFTLHM